VHLGFSVVDLRKKVSIFSSIVYCVSYPSHCCRSLLILVLLLKDDLVVTKNGCKEWSGGLFSGRSESD
jgi:hypothetical protein